MEKLPPVPRGFKLHEHQTGNGVKMAFLACETCGSLVIFPEKHKAWHKKNGG